MKKYQPSDYVIPEEFLDRMGVLLGEEYKSFSASFQQLPLSGLRVNTPKISTENLKQLITVDLTRVPWCESGYIIESAELLPMLPGKHPYHAAGLYYLQEPSAMAVAEILSPRPGDLVLDLCAAPGGKSTHLAALMNNTGLLVANEIHPRRVWDLAENIERFGISNAVITNETSQRLAERFGPIFDRVLVDAPCSGEGMFRKSVIARREWKPELVLSCAARQSAILDQAAEVVKPGGRLAYTTCTFSAEENEGVINIFLENHPEFQISDIAHKPGFCPAIPEWVNPPVRQDLNKAIRIWPHLAPGEGHFIALLEKRSLSSRKYIAKGGKRYSNREINSSNLPGSLQTTLDGFMQTALHPGQIDNGDFFLEGTFVYKKPPIGITLDGIRVIRPGLWLGSIKSERFRPSHSLALAIKSSMVKQTLNFAADDPRLAAYLAGESLHETGDDGWILVTVDSYPIGWGKRVKNIIKNYYPHGLRRRVD